jgi:hypothetical protein
VWLDASFEMPHEKARAFAAAAWRFDRLRR